MGRIWALAGTLIAALTILLVLGPLGGPQLLLTAALCVGAGAAAAYLAGPDHSLARGLWLLVGVLFGALGFVLGASMFPDTEIGLYLGGVVPITLTALATMWTRRQSDFLCGVLASGALSGVYATRFNIDPQSLNYSLPIAMGQTLLCLALGYFAAVLLRAFVPADDALAVPATAPAEPATDAAHADADVEVAR
jgi:hypothetical protein